MPDLAPALATNVLDLTCGIRREVIVMDISLGVYRAEVIQFLCLTQRAKRCERQDLSLTAGKETSPMCARGHAYFDPYRADFGRRSSIGTLALTQNSFAHD